MSIAHRLAARWKSVLLAAALSASCTAATPGSASAAPAPMCGQYATAPVADGRYIVDNNNYGGFAQCLTVDQEGGFTVATSGANVSPPAGPAAYPEIFEGCHWGTCTDPAKTELPLPVREIGSATSSWSTRPTSTGNYNTAYDLWFNSTPTTDPSGQPDGAELMIWLDRRPASDSPPGTVANIGGVPYLAWQTTMSANGKTWPLLGYRLQNPAASVTDLDLRAFVRDAVVRGVVNPDWHLIAVEAGFEIWNGGQGLGTESFSSSSKRGYPVGPTTAGTPGKCMDDAGNATTPDNPVILWTCHGGAAQQWTVAMDGTIGHAGMCLGTTGAMVALHPCNGSPYQQWLPALGGGLWNVGSGLCLRDGSSGTVDGTQLDLVTCDGSVGQRWTLPTTVAASPA
ncbi:ricin-type beta-trefoil lectin domain protein [Embleya sp. AB8]|uniref:ricin-type beta-trefoil lectin domain protein n=1 Tax=Embleya sp. AB8 TaxID=3156304 RepID=UPI003C74442E